MALAGQPRTILPTFGPKRSVFNNSSSAIGANLCVTDDSTAKDYVKLPAAASDPVVGVTGPEGIPAKSWGSIANVGGSKLPIVNASGVTVGTRLGVNTAGKVVTLGSSAGTNYSLVGVADETAADGDAGEVTFAGPGAIAQG